MGADMADSGFARGSGPPKKDREPRVPPRGAPPIFSAGSPLSRGVRKASSVFRPWKAGAGRSLREQGRRAMKYL